MKAYAEMGGLLDKVALKELFTVAKKLNKQEENQLVFVSAEQDLEIRMGLARDRGEVEPELYKGDKLIGPNKVRPETEQDQATLESLIELQERMAQGMKLIHQCDETISRMFANETWMGALYRAWNISRNPETLVYWTNRKTKERSQMPAKETMAPEDIRRFMADKRNGRYIKWFDARRELWAHWFSLKAACDELVGEKNYIWGQYYALKDFTFDPYWMGEMEYVQKIDEQKDGWDNKLIQDNEAMTHIRENKEFLAWKDDKRALESKATKTPASEEQLQSFYMGQVNAEEAAYMSSLLQYVQDYIGL
jgi:hypothetical protein